MKFVATNPNSNATITLAAEDRQEFILELVKKAPHYGWYPDEVRQCVQDELIEELPAC